MKKLSLFIALFCLAGAPLSYAKKTKAVGEIAKKVKKKPGARSGKHMSTRSKLKGANVSSSAVMSPAVVAAGAAFLNSSVVELSNAAEKFQPKTCNNQLNVTDKGIVYAGGVVGVGSKASCMNKFNPQATANYVATIKAGMDALNSKGKDVDNDGVIEMGENTNLSGTIAMAMTQKLAEVTGTPVEAAKGNMEYLCNKCDLYGDRICGAL